MALNGERLGGNYPWIGAAPGAPVKFVGIFFTANARGAPGKYLRHRSP